MEFMKDIGAAVDAVYIPAKNFLTFFTGFLVETGAWWSIPAVMAILYVSIVGGDRLLTWVEARRGR